MRLYKCVETGKCNISGQRIRELREAAGLTQDQLAARVQLFGHGINQKIISRIEVGERVMPDYELLYFAKALHTSVYDLLGLE